jgi:hypothetical protein
MDVDMKNYGGESYEKTDGSFDVPRTLRGGSDAHFGANSPASSKDFA